MSARDTLDEVVGRLFDCAQLLNDIDRDSFIDTYALKQCIQSTIAVAMAEATKAGLSDYD